MSDLTVQFNQPQDLTYQALKPGSTICLPWGRGVGKSWFFRTVMYLSVAESDGVPREGSLEPMTGVRWVLMLPTFKQATDLYAAPMEHDLGPEGKWAFLGASINRTKWRITFPGGSWIQLFGAENAEKSRGLRVDGVGGDEVDDIPIPVWDSIISPWFSEPWSLRLRMGGGTPLRGRQGLLYQLHERGSSDDPKKRKKRYFSLHATGYDTPENVSREYLDEQKEELPKETFDREYGCNFDSSAGLVYPSFYESFHVREPEPGTSWSEMIVCGDHGFEDPGVLILIGLRGSGLDTEAHILHECYQRRELEEFWIAEGRRLVGWYPEANWYLDPSRPDRIDAFRKLAKAKIKPADNAIKPGLETVARMLKIRVRQGPNGAPISFARLYISPKCVNTIFEFSNYKRKVDARDPNLFSEEIVDKRNHAMDSVRYGLHTRLGPVYARGRNKDASIEARQ